LSSVSTRCRQKLYFWRRNADISEMTSWPVEEGGARAAGGGAPASVAIRLQARILAGLFAAGATLALLTVLLPHSRRANEVGLLIIVADAYLVAAALFWRVGDRHARRLPVALAWGSTLITGVAYFSAQSPSPLVFFYLWVFLYSAYFLTKMQATLQIIYVGIAYAALLLASPPSSGVPGWWVVGMGTLLVGAVLIRVMRDQAEVLIARLYEAARTDPLTNLTNRRGFREMLDLEIQRALRSERPMAVVTGDLDRFKQVNDRAGHHVGDATLKRTADILTQGKRPTDLAARVGGEEFALILPDTDGSDAFVVAERLRGELQAEFSGASVPTTISFGIAIYPDHGQTAASLLRAADDALYAAKESGRDRTVLHSHALEDMPARGDKRDVEGERFLAVMLELAEAVDLRFSGSARHSETVGRYAVMMAQALGISEQRSRRVRLAGMLHDIGKVAIPDAILQKPGPLTEQEFAIMKTHPELGAQILEHDSLSDVRAWVYAHHERPDGRGYPLGLGDDAIDLEAKIIAVADAFEAMTSDRAYRPAIGHDAARAELERNVGTQFDPVVVAAFTAILQREADRAQVTLNPQTPIAAATAGHAGLAAPV
jgi:diguanylate cyclase (GGDEF)-like protein/putative nucleotidyltransferase with HDIG domain